ncbi:alpha/beta hydrolase [Streptomyces sp. MUM 178J]|uniref:alpha/beta hydrolase n=1 Tax=Streptomyces sp. MUM 178J TaxID=2791991 RepID=UPI001F04A900|nr:alpha/beta hydrolase [Streptomyces sp. MUM 178J]WRQ81094.1 alpha/beta hydrolase [Streptomyces sp. MUM 178J]
MTGTALTWRRLRDLKRTEFEGAADKWNEVSGRSDADRMRVDRAMSAKLRDTQGSESAEAALGRLKRLSRNFQYLHTECGLVRTVLNGLAADLAEPQRQLKQALDEAAGLKFTVHEDGSVSYPAATADTLTGEKEVPGGQARGSGRYLLDPPALGSDVGSPFLRSPNPNAAKAQDIADRIARAVASAAEIDRRYTATLSELRAAKGLAVTDATLKDVSRDAAEVRTTAGKYLEHGVPFDKSPAVRKEWWDALTDEQRQEYLNVAPDVIGNLDGVPAVARDEANRHYLPVLMDKLSGQDSEDARTKLDALRRIEEQLNTPSRPPVFLLGIGDEGNGRAIVAYGNPDTARNVSAYVPGLGTKLDKEFVEDTMVRAQDTAKGAREYDKSSAAIIWLGYDAPQHVDVASTGDAERGAPAYNAFMSGISATNGNEDPHFTAIGHSYGSLTVGTAARQSGGIPGVDDVVLVGSPGVGVDKAQDLGVGRDHVFVGAADNDPVSQLPSKQQGAAGFLGLLAGGPLGAYVAGDLADQGDDDLYFGKDPASESFGARRFRVDDGPRPLGDLGGFDAHSQYFTPETDEESADNIARIVAGQSNRITTEEWR